MSTPLTKDLYLVQAFQSSLAYFGILMILISCGCNNSIHDSNITDLQKNEIDKLISNALGARINEFPDSVLYYSYASLLKSDSLMYFPGIAHSCDLIGDVLIEKSLIDDALVYYSKGYNYYTKCGDTLFEHETMKKIDKIEALISIQDTAKRRAALRQYIYENKPLLGTQEEASEAYKQFLHIINSVKRESMDSTENCLKILGKNINNKTDSVFLLDGMITYAEGLISKSNYSTAINILQQADKLCKQITKSDSLHELMFVIGSKPNYINLTLGECYFHLNKYDIANSYFGQLDLTHKYELNKINIIIDCNKILGLTNHVNYLQQIYITYIDSINSVQNKENQNFNYYFTKIESNRIANELTLNKEQLTNKADQINILKYAIIFFAIVLAIGTGFFMQSRKLTNRNISLQNKKIQSLLSDQELKSINAMLEGQDNERKRIAEDLHDRVGSILSTIKLYFGSLNSKIDSYQDENKQQYEKANLLLDEAVQEVRRISHNLVSGILMKFGLVPALKDLCDTVDGTQQLKTNLKVFHVDERMDGQTEISIYRIIQELLSNVLKHAKATEVTISLTRNDGNLNIIVEDNGKGFDTDANYEGIGLKNIRSRVEKLNGQVKFDSLIDRGTTVIIDLPVDETPNEV